MRRSLATLALAAFLVAEPALADMVFLRDGNIVLGSIEYQSPTIIRIRTASGSRTIRKEDISRISYDAEEEERYLAEQERQEGLEEELEEAREELARAREELEAERRRARQVETQIQGSEARFSSGRWRSLIYPGWGQFHRGETTVGTIYMVSAGLALFQWYQADRDYQEKLQAFESASTLSLLSASTGSASVIGSTFFLANEARNEQQAAASVATFYSTLYIALYLVNIVDIYFSGSPTDLIQPEALAPAGGLFIGAAPGSRPRDGLAWSAGYHWQF